MRQTLELHAVGLERVRQQLRRRQPRASETEIEHQLAAWLIKPYCVPATPADAK